MVDLLCKPFNVCLTGDQSVLLADTRMLVEKTCEYQNRVYFKLLSDDPALPTPQPTLPQLLAGDQSPIELCNQRAQNT